MEIPLTSAPEVFGVPSPAVVPTAWEQKEWDGLLALETPEWREKRLTAEDPNTTADVLERLAHEVGAAGRRRNHTLTQTTVEADIKARRMGYASDEQRKRVLLAEAVIAHPNTPSFTLLTLIEFISRKHVGRGLCRNPIIAFIALEIPDFWMRLDNDTCYLLLGNETLPRQAALFLRQHKKKYLVTVARLHVSVAGELQSRTEGQAALAQFWQAFCIEKLRTTLSNDLMREHNELLHWELAPRWGALGVRRDMAAYDTPSHKWYETHVVHLLRSHNPLIRYWAARFVSRRYRKSHSAFVRFVVTLRGAPYPARALYHMGISLQWMDRLNAALALPLSPEPFRRDPWNRSPLDLLNHLAHDGNRFVRWAAQMRLDDPGFEFTWSKDERG